LKSHDAGEDRHNKNLAWIHKANRLDTKHQRMVSSKAPKKKNKKQLLVELERAAIFLEQYGERHQAS
jgi:hypothetical protein